MEQVQPLSVSDSNTKKRLLLVINPVAGKRAGIKSIEMLQQTLRDGCYEVDLFETQSRGDATIAAREKAGNYDVIACCGGDGTLNEVITGLIGLPNPPQILCIPAGTTNLLAETLQLPLKNIAAAAQKLSDFQLQPFDIGTFGKEYFCCVVSFGAFADSSYATPQKLKNKLGYGAYVLGGARSLLHLHKTKMRIEADGTVYEGEYIFGAFSNCTVIGGILRYDHSQLSVDDGYFEGFLVKVPKTPAAFHRIMAALRKKKYDPRTVQFFHAKSIKIFCEKPIPWTIDGEYRGDFSDIEVGVLPQAVTFLK